jgi:hypothetical protein
VIKKCMNRQCILLLVWMSNNLSFIQHLKKLKANLLSEYLLLGFNGFYVMWQSFLRVTLVVEIGSAASF